MLALALGVTTANAQISSGEVSSTVIRTGNRAQAGDWGIYLGATTDMFSAIGDKNTTFKALPLINVKYMKSDNLEYRLGLEWWDKTSTGSYDGKLSTGSGESRYMFYPGIAHHFAKTNLLDVYVGGELPIGWGHHSKRTSADDKYSAAGFNIGLGGFIGLQAYIANLPVAVGLEYGIHTLYNTVSDGGFAGDGQYIVSEKSSASKWALGHQARLTFSYYFKAK